VTTECLDECCAPPPLVVPPKSSDREALIREAFKLEWLTIGWMSRKARLRLDHATPLPSGDESCGRANFIVAEQRIRFGASVQLDGLRSG
jgi:hypothetical protein